MNKVKKLCRALVALPQFLAVYPRLFNQAMNAIWHSADDLKDKRE